MDERRIADWYQKYSTEIYRFCLTLLSDRALAEDALQETFLKALRSPEKSIHRGQEKSWLYQIAKHTCYDMLRKQRREMPQGTAEEFLCHIPEKDPGHPLDFADMVSSLAKEDKEIVSLRIIGGFSHREIARMTGFSLHAEKKRYERAIQKLRREYEEESG